MRSSPSDAACCGGACTAKRTPSPVFPCCRPPLGSSSLPEPLRPPAAVCGWRHCGGPGPPPPPPLHHSARRHGAGRGGDPPPPGPRGSCRPGTRCGPEPNPGRPPPRLKSPQNLQIRSSSHPLPPPHPHLPPQTVGAAASEPNRAEPKPSPGSARGSTDLLLRLQGLRCRTGIPVILEPNLRLLPVLYPPPPPPDYLTASSLRSSKDGERVGTTRSTRTRRCFKTEKTDAENNI